MPNWRGKTRTAENLQLHAIKNLIYCYQENAAEERLKGWLLFLAEVEK